MADLRHAHAIYDQDGHKLTLMRSDCKVGVWELYEGATYLGAVPKTGMPLDCQETRGLGRDDGWYTGA